LVTSDRRSRCHVENTLQDVVVEDAGSHPVDRVLQRHICDNVN